MPHSPAAWWRTASIYQVYIRSFADGNGDGVGDIAGIRARLPYLRDLGVDALWITPWYLSPMADAGYDVADYRDIDPLFGTLAEAEALIARGARARPAGHRRHRPQPLLRPAPVVPGGARGRPRLARARPLLVPSPAGARRRASRRTTGSPTSAAPAWTRVTEPTAQWYLHLFAPEQPDLNWDEPRGARGVRADPALLARPRRRRLPHRRRARRSRRSRAARRRARRPTSPTLPVRGPARGARRSIAPGARVTDAYDRRARASSARSWVADARAARAATCAPTSCTRRSTSTSCARAWEAAAMRDVIDDTLAAHAPVGAPPTWVLSNHDVIRHVTRYGRARHRASTCGRQAPRRADRPRARAAAAPAPRRCSPRAARRRLRLPGRRARAWPRWRTSPTTCSQDPSGQRSGHTDRGRDGCRVPLPWGGEAPPFGFAPPDAATAWLPQPPSWRALTVEAQAGDPGSMLALYRAALRLRRTDLTRLPEAVSWLDAGPGTVAFIRGDGFRLRRQPLPKLPSSCPRTTASCSPAVPSSTGCCPRTPAPGSA